jgi:glutathione S-transferase
MGYAGDCGISQRGHAECRPVAAGPRIAGALPLDLWGNPFRIHHFAGVAAGQPERSLPELWARAQADIDRVCTIWRECLAKSGGPFLFGERTMADAMYAPVVTRFMTYDVKLEPGLKAYADMIMALPEMRQWTEAAKAEPADIEELEVEY